MVRWNCITYPAVTPLSYFEKHPEQLPKTYVKLMDNYKKEQVICDYLSSMTDRYAVYTFNRIFVPKGWNFTDEQN